MNIIKTTFVGVVPIMLWAADFKVLTTIDRTTVFPKVPYQELTLRLPIGDAASAKVFVDGQLISSRIDVARKMLIFSTKGSAIEAYVVGVSTGSQIGTFKKTVLRDDKKWAWSHGFDDNTGYSHYGTEVFNKYGWAGTLFMIGATVLPDSGINWACTESEVRRLYRAGWAIGNHGYNHNTCGECTWDEKIKEITDCQAAIKRILAPVDPTYTPMSFASPAFSHAYNDVIKYIRSERVNDIGIMYVEGQGENANSGWRLDSGATEPPWRWVWTADSNKVVPRSGALYEWGSADWAGKQNEFQWAIDSMIYYADDTHHYWLNSLGHAVDHFVTDGNIDNCNRDVFGFVPWLYKKCGSGGDNSVWVAPAEKVYSYYITQLTSKLSQTTIAGLSTATTAGAMSIRSKMVTSNCVLSVNLTRYRNTGATVFDLRGKRLRSGYGPERGVFILKR